MMPGLYNSLIMVSQRLRLAIIATDWQIYPKNAKNTGEKHKYSLDD